MTVRRTTIYLGLALFAATLPSVSSAQSATPTVEQRLARVEDELAIRRIITAYSNTQDAHDYEGYVALFASNGEWISGKTVHRGPAAIRQMLIGFYGPQTPGYVNGESFHISFNADVRLDGDRATATSRHVLFMRGDNGQPVPMLSGRYDDEFVRENGQWKILRRIDTPVMPTADEWTKIITAIRAAQ